LEARPISSNWIPVTSKLEKARRYELSIGQVKIVAGEASHVCIRLYDMQNRVGVSVNTFAVGDDKSVSGVRWKFNTPSADGDYRVIAYAGIPGKCNGVGVTYTDVSVV
jgi:hypothetical protein